MFKSFDKCEEIRLKKQKEMEEEMAKNKGDSSSNSDDTSSSDEDKPSAEKEVPEEIEE